MRVNTKPSSPFFLPASLKRQKRQVRQIHQTRSRTITPVRRTAKRFPTIRISPNNIQRPRIIVSKLPDNTLLVTASGVVQTRNAVSKDDAGVLVPIEFFLSQAGEVRLFPSNSQLLNSTILLTPNASDQFDRDLSTLGVFNADVRLVPTEDGRAKQLRANAVVHVQGCAVLAVGYAISASISSP
ncbi:hypothetical protein [Paenibacillus cremeus]|uniref:Uncharacterized protein n=1 Tax=Paenibacillus cremeus TaxID=2163881 RepID=A0A559K7Q3_9BACL|nr:hypothetical protein [Paenibacillus cremeus]TVY08170.1 hypothetical protein FPZ49_19905 [Paenibacillus cremeus]